MFEADVGFLHPKTPKALTPNSPKPSCSGRFDCFKVARRVPTALSGLYRLAALHTG